MGDLSKNLSRHEMLCSCSCGFDTVDYKLVEVLQGCADHFKAYIIITGGNRCKIYNDAMREEYELSGGKHGANTAKNSQHIYGRAADFKLFGVADRQQISPIRVYEFLDANYSGSLGVGLYHNRVHVDTKTGKARRWMN